MNKKTFHLGISMAGAISAGAYTAGVIDYLIEALDNWQKAKQLQEEGKLSGIPKHEISIDILSGASAGGMTAALTSAAIHTDFEPIYKIDIENNSDKLCKNPLYRAWVNLTEDENSGIMEQMLSTNDIEKINPNNEVYSVFNSTFIKTVVERHINETVSDPNFKRSYFADDLEVVTTLTNLRGIPFEDKFGTPAYTKVHRMTKHFDLAHFKLKPSGEYEKDKDGGRIPLHFRKKGCNKDILVQSAMATGSYPIGLEPRIIKRLGKYIIDNHYINERKQENIHTVNPVDVFETLNVDGGTINNDPYILTQKILNERLSPKDETNDYLENSKNQYKTNASDFGSAVIVIDPFPSDSTIPSTNYIPLKAFKSIIPNIFSAMIGELRMKEDILKSVYGNDDYTKFLIIPSRSGANKEIENYIACGSFGGFGGFFSKDFRQHDFLLGRRNCQQFLRKRLSIPLSVNRPILKYGYEDISKEDINKNFAVGAKNEVYLPIIPDLRVIETDNSTKVIFKNDFSEEKPEFPRIKLSYLLNLNDLLKKRFSLILNNINKGKDLNEKDIQNDIVDRIRKKAWYKKVFSLIDKPSKNFVLWITIGYAKGYFAEKFIDMVIINMDKNSLLEDDMKE